MVNVKIECGCGQPYAFDVEPVDGQMASTVACPSCGTDGTAVANQIIAGQLAPELPPLVSTGGRVRVDARSLGLVDRETASAEARAKISWGDSQDDVIRYLMLQGFSVPEASELVQEFYKERLAALRVKGIRKIMIGSGMMCVPVIAFLTFAHLGVIPLKIMGIAIAVGLWGCWLVLNGIITLVAPKMESGDVTE